MGHIWNIINFLVHQIRADGRPSEGLFRQQQALIRTLPTPSAQLADSLKLLFTWRGKAEPRALRHSLLLITIALIFALGSMTASIFSSYAVVGSNLEVLVSSPLCGLADSKGNNLNDFGYWSKVSVLGEQYADDCYGNDTAIPTRCNVFIKPRIMFTAETASCPFQNRHRCSSEAVAIDTGLLDFNDDFGLNLGKEENVKYRQRMTCAVLDQQNLTSVINADMLPPHVRDWDPLPGEQVQAYHLGLRPDGSNFTFGINLLHNRLSEGLSHS